MEPLFVWGCELTGASTRLEKCITLWMIPTIRFSTAFCAVHSEMESVRSEISVRVALKVNQGKNGLKRILNSHLTRTSLHPRSFLWFFVSDCAFEKIYYTLLVYRALFLSHFAVKIGKLWYFCMHKFSFHHSRGFHFIPHPPTLLHNSSSSSTSFSHWNAVFEIERI